MFSSECMPEEVSSLVCMEKSELIFTHAFIKKNNKKLLVGSRTWGRKMQLKCCGCF